MAVRIPAWKRLGLKLKYANEQPDDASATLSTKAHDPDLQASERPTKRRRLAEESSTESHIANGSSEFPNGSVINTRKPIQRKKSVTFSEETKQEDGDSRTTIDFPVGSPGSTPRKSKTGLEDSSDTGASPNQPLNNDTGGDSHEITPTKKEKKLKSKNGKNSKQRNASTKDKSSSALDYLNQHRSDRQAWKFNKILDVWILNHALDTQAIPSTHVPALGGYVRGLPAKAGSRTRLIEECRAALAKSQLARDTAEQDQRAYIKFIDHQSGPLQSPEAAEEFLQSHSRPAVLLWALDEPVGASNGASSVQSSAEKEVHLPARKKKSRTSAPVDISSSSESDSDGDSSDDSSDSEGAMKTNGNGESASKTDDTSSSSGSSSEAEEESSSPSTSSDESSSNDSDEEN